MGMCHHLISLQPGLNSEIPSRLHLDQVEVSSAVLCIKHSFLATLCLCEYDSMKSLSHLLLCYIGNLKRYIFIPFLKKKMSLVDSMFICHCFYLIRTLSYFPGLCYYYCPNYILSYL